MARQVRPRVLALFAHPDDVEFRAGGTMLLLAEAGYELHYATMTAGDLGALSGTRAKIAAVRKGEARRAAKLLGAKWHAPFAHDMQIVYGDRLLRKAAALVRLVAPTILLTHALADYMEDHMETARLAVSAAFVRGAPLYRTTPPRRAIDAPITVYHATPHGLEGPLGEPAQPALLVDTGSVHERKLAALACHASQSDWLDATQGPGSYLDAAERESRALGASSRRFTHAEGWTRHATLGFCAADADPLAHALGARVARSDRTPTAAPKRARTR